MELLQEYGSILVIVTAVVLVQTTYQMQWEPQ